MSRGSEYLMKANRKITPNDTSGRRLTVEDQRAKNSVYSWLRLNNETQSYNLRSTSPADVLRKKTVLPRLRLINGHSF